MKYKLGLTFVIQILTAATILLLINIFQEYNNNNCRVPIWGVSFHCRCERIQAQQAQYNEFSREAGLRTGRL